jgi:hypothetical protein
MLDYERLVALFFCLGLFGLFAAVFNLQTLLTVFRRGILRTTAR